MHRHLPPLIALTFSLAAACLAPGAEPTFRSGLQPGQDLPGSFEVHSVIHPNKDHEGKFHSPVCEQGLRPTVLVLVRTEGDSDMPVPVGGLLKKLDELVAANRAAELACYVIFLNDGGYRAALEKNTDVLAEAIKARAAEAEKVRDLAKDLKAIALSLDAPEGPKGYQINAAANLTVLLCVKQKVTANFAFSKDHPLTEKDQDAIAAEVAKLLPAKPSRIPSRAAAR